MSKDIEQKSKASKARVAATTRYNLKSYDRISVVIPKGDRDRIKRYASEHGFRSVNSFIVSAVNDKFSQGGEPPIVMEEPTQKKAEPEK